MTGRLMSQKYPGSVVYFEPAMTFEEIALEMGIPKQAVYFLFVSALKKIRHNPEARRRLLELYEAKEALRTYYPEMPW